MDKNWSPKHCKSHVTLTNEALFMPACELVSWSVVSVVPIMPAGLARSKTNTDPLCLLYITELQPESECMPLQHASELFARAAAAGPTDARTWLNWALLERRRSNSDAARRSGFDTCCE